LVHSRWCTVVGNSRTLEMVFTIEQGAGVE
jgi:hypothetical protein